MPRCGKPRKKRTVRIKLDLQQWVEEQVKKGKFRNFSHVVDVALEKLRDTKEKEEKSDQTKTA